MANHCYNECTFTGAPKDLKKLLTRLTRIQSEDNDNKYGINFYARIYHKILFKKPDCVNDVYPVGFDVYSKYGSKWFDCTWEESLNSDGTIDSIHLSGDSAWSPVLPLFKSVCIVYNLHGSGSYEEPGMDFAGVFEIDSIGAIEERQMTYSEHLQETNPEGYWENIINNIDDGCYNSFEDVLAEFNPSIFELSKGEKEELNKLFTDYLSKLDQTVPKED